MLSVFGVMMMYSGRRAFFSVAKNIFLTVFVGYISPEERLMNAAAHHGRNRRNSPLGLRGSFCRYF